MRSFLLSAACTVLVACGGNVVVDATAGSGGKGGSGGAGGMATASTTATTSTSSSSSSSSGSSGCPVPFSGVEGACSTAGMTCPVPGACCDGTAVCENGFWKYLPPPCQQLCTPECGPDGFACAGNRICVANIGQTTTYECAPNPCAPGPVDCACAAPLCAAQLMCNNIQMGFKVLCD
jgi:hypothetical protein